MTILRDALSKRYKQDAMETYRTIAALLDPNAPLPDCIDPPPFIIEAKQLEDFVGTYQLQEQFTVTISQEGQQLYAQAAGQAQFEIFPKNENSFYALITEISLTFNRDENKQVKSLTLKQGAFNGEMKKVQ